MKEASFYDAAYFDQPGAKSNYSAYTETTANFAAYADAVQAMLQRHGLPERGPVLDVGAAKGFLVAELRRRGLEAVGVDVSRYAMNQAPANVQPYLMYGSALGLPSLVTLMAPIAHGLHMGPFALACSFDVLEHFDEAHARVALREAARVSVVQFHQVNTNWTPAVAFHGDESHVLDLPLSEWRRLAREEGCVNTTIVETGRGEVSE